MRARTDVVAKVMSFLGALALVGLGLSLTAVVLAQAVGAAYEALGILGAADTPSGSLPFGTLAAMFMQRPTFRSVAAASFALTVWMLTLLAIHGAAILVRAWSAHRREPVREFALDHLGLLVGVSTLAGAAGIAAVFEGMLWALRARADIALAALPGSPKAHWMQAAIDGHRTVMESALDISWIGAWAMVSITVGLAIGLEFSLHRCGVAWRALGEAVDELRNGTVVEAFLDMPVPVIGSDDRKERITRRSAALNPDYVLDDEGRVFSAAFVEQLSAFERGDEEPESHERLNGRRNHLSGILACIAAGLSWLLYAGLRLGLAAVFASVLVWGGGIARASENDLRADVPQVRLVMAVDFSGTTKATKSLRVNMVREALTALRAEPSTDPREELVARYDISVLSIDSFGGELLWRGSEFKADELTDAWWSVTLAGRQGACTKLSEAWRTIGSLLRDATPCTLRTQVIVLSDLISEEPLARNPRKCQPARYSPGPDVPWDDLKRADVIRVYFVPDVVKAAWATALAEHDLSDRMLLHAGGDPSGTIPIIEPAEFCEPTTADRERFFGTLKKVALGAAVVVAVLLAIAFIV